MTQCGMKLQARASALSLWVGRKWPRRCRQVMSIWPLARIQHCCRASTSKRFMKNAIIVLRGPDIRFLPSHRKTIIAFFLKRRSEEHTYELQSLTRISYAVSCLKKKQIRNNKITSQHNWLLHT